jgi:filamentous hemagglutinin family protein
MKLASFRRPLLTGPFAAFAMAALLLPGPVPSIAGDILRGGASPGNPAKRAAAATQSTAAAAAAARSNARDNLVRTTQALQSVQAMQTAARAAAAAAASNNAGFNPNAPATTLPNVPNGLGAGGLEVDPGVVGGTAVWTGANAPTQSTGNGRTTVNIRQTQQTALLSWKTFNVGHQTTLRYDQSAGDRDVNKWVAFNKVNDPSNAPSQILGSIEAPGQVYVINRNGIIFGGASQVNVGTLVASSLPINDNLIARGLLNNPDAQFLFSGMAIPAGAQGTPAFTPDPVNPAIGRYGDITVQPGAVISSPTNEAKSGGRVMLVGPNVQQRGSILTPDGQTILVAGMQVGISAHPSSDPSLRGLDVYVGSAPSVGGATAGTVEQSGLVTALRGNITLAGREIEQNGALESSSSVSLNGRIDVQTSYNAIPNAAFNPSNPASGTAFLPQLSGTVRFGAGSVTRVLPELGSTETAVGRELALRSQINVTGRAIHLGRDASLQASSGEVRLSAGEWRLLGIGGTNPTARFVQSAGQVYLDSNALIDVAGSTGIAVSILQHILSLELRGAELANSPVQRETSLRDQAIQVDVRNSGTFNGLDWVGTPLADANGFAGLIQRTVGEFTAPGGTVTISAGESVVLREGSKIDASGGYLSYEGAKVKTTRLVLGNRVVDIKDATPNRVYDGIYTGQITTKSERWDVTNTYDQPLALTGERWESDYLEGADGGRIDLSAPSMAIDGTLRGQAFDGPRQRTVGADLSTLRLAFLAQDTSYPSFPTFSPTPPTVTFRAESDLAEPAPFSIDGSGDPAALSAERIGRVVLSPDLLGETGFGNLIVENPDGNVNVTESVTLAATEGGSITLSASNLTIDGDVLAPGGSLSFSANNLSLAAVNSADFNRVRPAPEAGRGSFTLGRGATLSTAGLIVDDRASGSTLLPPSITGGTIAIAGFDVRLGRDSLVDVSGGVQLSTRGRATYGNAGTLSITAGKDLHIAEAFGGGLFLGGRLRGYSGARGGTMNLSALAFQIGGGSAPAGVAHLDPSFFSQGGFAAFSLRGMGLPGATFATPTPGVHVVGDTKLHPVVDSYVAVPNPVDGSGANLARVTKPEGLRTPVSLSFQSTGASDSFNSGFPIVRGDLVVGQGSSIVTDGLGSVSLRGETTTVLGRIVAPGGNISVAGAGSFALAAEAVTSVYIGANAVLNTAGKAIIRRGINDWREGQILAGGTVSVTGNIVAESGSVINVSGTSGTLDQSRAYRNPNATPLTGLRGQEYVPVRSETNGGTVNFTGSQMLFSDATLIGNAGGASAIGGTVNVTSGRYVQPGTAFTSADANLVVVQDGRVLPDGGLTRGVGLPVRDAGGASLTAIGNFAVDRFQTGGFASLALNGNVRFDESVSIQADASLRVASSGAIYSNDAVNLRANYVALGQAFRAPTLATDQIVLFTQTDLASITTPYSFAPTSGAGSLTVRAETIDVGTLSLQGFRSANLNAAKGDIRGNGTFQMVGDLSLQAGQIYPTTLRSFDIFAYDPVGGSGSVTLSGGAARSLPLSAGGQLGIYASEIRQDGTLRAPIGTIELGWDGSGAAPINEIARTTATTPTTDLLTLGSHSVTSVSGNDPITGRNVLIPFGISFDGSSWIDPAGNDITAGGVPGKQVSLAGGTVVSETGSVIDVRGGGDLYAYRWVNGNGGTRDILASNNLFAVIPGYDFDYAPHAPFNNTGGGTNLQSEPGYVNGTLKPGDRITLGASENLPGGTYTLLPARYALLPDAVLVTPLSGAPVGTHQQEDGASFVSGYRSSDLDPGRVGRTTMQRFEVASAGTFRERAEYVDFTANTFLRKAAVSRDLAPPRLPVDSGYLSFSSTAAMSLAGSVLSNPRPGGRGALVDISSPGDILVNLDGSGGGAGVLALSTSLLNSFRAESLLLGGKRSLVENRYVVATSASNVTIDNAGSPLSGSDLVLVAKEAITVTDGSSLIATGNATADPLFLGNAGTIGSGDGALLRVSGSDFAPIVREGVGNSTLPSISLGANTLLRGGAITVDSTYAGSVNPTTRIESPVLNLNSGQISIQLDNPGALNPTDGLVLTGQALDTIQQTTRDLTLLSYSSIDLYGTGTIGSRALEQLTLQASALRGFNQAGGDFQFVADEIVLENATDRPFPTLPAAPLDGRLRFDASQITVGRNDLRVERFARVELAADSRLLVSGDGSFSTEGKLAVVTPLITGAGAARHRISSAGALSLTRPVGGTVGASGGLGARLDLEGASLAVETDILLNSGQINLRAHTGDLRIGANDDALISAAGISETFLDVIRYTSGGSVNLSADNGSVFLDALSVVDVAAPAAGGDAGFLNISAPTGTFALSGSILGGASAGRRSGSFSLDSATIAGNTLTATDAVLNAGGFNEARSYRLRTGDFTIGGLAKARDYRAYADSGSITVTGNIDASGTTGGRIDLSAHLDLILASGALLDASSDRFSASGQGGKIFLGAGASRDGLVNTGASLDLRTGSRINLGVAAAVSTSPSLGQFTGTLHLRAPQTGAFDDVQIEAIGSDIDGASAIFVEAYRLYDLTGGGQLDNSLLNTLKTDGEAFLGIAGTTGGFYNAIQSRLTSLQPGLDLILGIGAEVQNRTGSLTLGSTASTTTEDWNLSAHRFGPDSAPGVLTLRAADNIDLYNAISDGFAGGPDLWRAPLLAHNANLPANTQSWSYRMAAGADFRSVDTREVRDLEDLGANAGMIRLGKNAGSATASGGNNALTASVIGNRFQVIRTGSGDIDVHAGRTLQLLNPFASIYTAGTQVANPTGVFAPGDFVTPILTGSISQGSLGAVQQTYPAQYAMAGGDVTLTAGGNLERKTQNNTGLVDDSSRQLPNNWLYRRGYVGSNGEYGSVTVGAGFITFNDPAASTSWWVDHSNFFQSVGALGGGDVTMIAGNEVRNVDAVIPTNARAPRGVPDASKIVELGGGDLLVRSGGDISGGVYYVERGAGRLEAGGSVTTNAARSPSLGTIQNLNNPSASQLDPNTWMPTTLFLGRSSFEVSARGDVLLGPMANAFLLPQGLNNRFWYKTYFSTFGEDTSVAATSLGGDVTLRNAVTLPQSASSTDILTAWLTSQNLLASGSAGAAFTQPWLRLAETSLVPFGAILPVRPPSLRLTAFDGDINLAGNITLAPSPRGQLELIASGEISAFQPTGLSNLLVPGQSVQAWSASSINVSDADPDAIPGAVNPFNYFAIVGSSTNFNNTTRSGFYDPVGRFFTDSRSTTGNFGVATTKQALHDSGLLHRNDPNPLRLYALGGNLSGLTLFSPKPSRINAARDITDVSFYLQNLAGSDASIVTAGRDIIPYNASSGLRNDAVAPGNAPATGQEALPGDIHLGGPGTLQVLAGRNLDLGTGITNADGSGSGLLTIGNTRNPFLPFAGADLVAGAGLGLATSLAESRLDIDGFVREFVKTPEGLTHLRELGVTNFDTLDAEEQARVALEVFYLVLRDAGRDFNNEDSPDFGTYDEGFAAIRSLFGGNGYDGDLLTRGRSIRTQNGGDINLFAPGGSLTLANTTIGNPLVPPGIVTESGGRVSIFTRDSVDIGVGRIFTLRGGDMMIWSSKGDIAAGVASKTVQSAPPTRVLIDPQSGAVETDLAGLATGGGIGVLATVAGIRPGNVDLIAPSGIIDAGDAGIRVTGNINLAATQVVNASNIAAGGSSSGAPSTPSVSTPSLGGLTAGASSTAAASSAAMDAGDSARDQNNAPAESTAEDLTPSVITVEVLGYGGGGDEEDEDEEER